MLGKIDVGVLLTLSLSLGVVSTILGKGVEERITSQQFSSLLVYLPEKKNCF